MNERKKRGPPQKKKMMIVKRPPPKKLVEASAKIVRKKEPVDVSAKNVDQNTNEKPETQGSSCVIV